MNEEETVQTSWILAGTEQLMQLDINWTKAQKKKFVRAWYDLNLPPFPSENEES